MTAPEPVGRGADVGDDVSILAGSPRAAERSSGTSAITLSIPVASFGYGRGRHDLSGVCYNSLGSAHRRLCICRSNRRRVVLGPGFEREQSAQVPGGPLAVLACSLQVRSGLRVLTPPNCA